ncbi:UDP-3-O-[3-hydroxymyristoyl] N-acetylglucosamine deacetylase [bacterium]|nr:UDP-3-O-[3-hydroxymyristoyl] N-acetylglucosamine deacetylase [bacterium]
MCTLKKSIALNGIGLHTGMDIAVKISPSKTGKIQFLREGVLIDAVYSNVISTNFAVTLGKNGKTISTIEHLLSAFHMLGIDSAVIEVNGPEIPILDGSAKPFVDALLSAGIEKINKTRKYFTITKPIEITMEDKYLLFLPSNKFEINYTISFDHPLLDKRSEELVIDRESFINNISPARTFTFLSVVNKLKADGLIKGGSFDNAIVLDDNGVVNGELRMENECLRHKMLDFIGDIFLLGMPIKARVIAYKAGHTLDVKAVKTLKYYNNFKKEKIPAVAGLSYLHNYLQK